MRSCTSVNNSLLQEQNKVSEMHFLLQKSYLVNVSNASCSSLDYLHLSFLRKSLFLKDRQKSTGSKIFQHDAQCGCHTDSNQCDYIGMWTQIAREKVCSVVERWSAYSMMFNSLKKSSNSLMESSSWPCLSWCCLTATESPLYLACTVFQKTTASSGITKDTTPKVPEPRTLPNLSSL